MDWKGFFKMLGHAAIGGAAVGASGVATGASFKQTGWAALFGAITSVFSLLSKPPAKATP